MQWWLIYRLQAIIDQEYKFMDKYVRKDALKSFIPDSSTKKDATTKVEFLKYKVGLGMVGWTKFGITWVFYLQWV